MAIYTRGPVKAKATSLKRKADRCSASVRIAAYEYFIQKEEISNNIGYCERDISEKKKKRQEELRMEGLFLGTAGRFRFRRFFFL